MLARIGVMSALNRNVERTFDSDLKMPRWGSASSRGSMTVFIYMDTSKQVGDPEHLRVFARRKAAKDWFAKHDPEGEAFARTVTERQRKRIYSYIDDERVAAIVSAIPRDTTNLSYMDQGRANDFKTASPGQQASALLELLLRQSAGTLIIDQPEDDLDNRVIMRIVELLRKSKTTRQLIFFQTSL